MNGMDDPAGKKPLPACGIACLLGSGAAVLLLCVAAYLFADIPAALWCRRLDASVKAVFEILTKLGVSTAYLVVSFALFVWFRFHRNAAFACRSLFFFAAIAVSGIAANVVKVIVGRYRPAMLFAHDLYGFDLFRVGYDVNSFPSGHAATAFSIATALSLFWPRLTAPLYILAFLVALSRVVIGSHFPGDVLAGAWLGAFTVWILARRFPRAASALPIRAGKERNDPANAS